MLVGAVTALLSFTELMADRTNHGKFTLLLHDTVKHTRTHTAGYFVIMIFWALLMK